MRGLLQLRNCLGISQQVVRNWVVYQLFYIFLLILLLFSLFYPIKLSISQLSSFTLHLILFLHPAGGGCEESCGAELPARLNHNKAMQ